MSKLTRENAILPFEPGIDLTGKEGYAAMLFNGTIYPVDDEGSEPIGVILNGDVTGTTVSVAIAAGGLSGTVLIKLGGPISVGNLLMARSDGTSEKSAGIGRYVFAQALEAGVAGEMVEAVLFRPYTN